MTDSEYLAEIATNISAMNTLLAVIVWAFFIVVASLVAWFLFKHLVMKIVHSVLRFKI